jgi:coenzyme F420-0:L-glutamate ligase/coenzyme F420-1:gamma-L-glutamate ligase
MGQAAEALPVILVRGLAPLAPHQPASALIRPPHQDLFR